MANDFGINVAYGVRLVILWQPLYIRLGIYLTL